MKRFLKNNGLSVVVFGLFSLFLVGESIAGLSAHNHDLAAHDQAPITYLSFITSGTFIEATTENWESEFLEMGAYALLTSFLIQRGSAESRKPDDEDSADTASKDGRGRAVAPWPVRRGGYVLRLYENSLTIAFGVLFLGAMALHLSGGQRAYNEQQRQHAGQEVSLAEFLGTSEFWFQSLQNWQSEFLGLGSMVVLSIFLRQRGSPESKPVESPHFQTGGG